MNCNQNCHEGLSSSKCVEFDENYTVYEKLSNVQVQLDSINKLFTKTVDSKTLGVGQDLLKTVQALVDNMLLNQSQQTNTSTTLNVNLGCLTGITCDSEVSQDQLNQIVINSLCQLQNEINQLKTLNNLYPNV